ncbi:MAG TPA: diguanylate cyclase [Bryobacteraceae bacterium]|nr:diguanylate cyclase [Bryobacteraceae bacterium]
MRENVTIAVVAPVQPEDFFDRLWEGVWEATFDLNSFGVQVQNLTTDHHDAQDQREILQRSLEAEVDAIAILPAHCSALDDLIAEHERHGTPVVTFHGDAPASMRSAFVGPNSYAAGTLAAEVLSKLMGGRGRILSFTGPMERHHFAQRHLGFRAGLNCQPYLEETVFANRVEGVTPELLAALGQADGIYVGCQDMVEVAAALDQAALSLPFVGFSNTERARHFLNRRIVSAIIDENRYLQGYFAVQKAYEAVICREQGGQLSGVTIPSTVAFAANAFELNNSLNNAFEVLIQQRTQVLCSYKDRLEKANADLLSLSITDPLTGLLNRRKFEEVIEQEVARALRYAPLSLLLIDLDYFKQVNDRYGHPAGDEALKTVAGVLKSCCRSTDVCARLGGDEFAVILPHADVGAAQVVRDRILHGIAQAPISVGQHQVIIGLSIGIANLPGDGTDSRSLIAAADSAMYCTKQASRATQALVS